MSASNRRTRSRSRRRAPSVLPKAHIVKIDTEGSEIDILSRMTSIDFDVIMLEYHSEANPQEDRWSC